MKKTKKLKKGSVKSDKFNLKNRIFNLYYGCFYFLKECKYFILFTFALFFCLSVFFSFFQIESLNKIILEQLKELVGEFEGLGIFQTIFKIFLNNVFVSFFGILSGILFFGILPILSIIVNSYVIGLVSKMSVDSSGILSLWRLFPHGIFEFPAIIFSFSLGIYLGMFLISEHPLKELKRRLINSMKFFFLIIVPLLIVAAVVEGVLVVMVK